MDPEVVRGEPTGGEAVMGRLGVLTGLSLVAGSIPIPFLPDRVLVQVRGVVAHEVAARRADRERHRQGARERHRWRHAEREHQDREASERGNLGGARAGTLLGWRGHGSI